MPSELAWRMTCAPEFDGDTAGVDSWIEVHGAAADQEIGGAALRQGEFYRVGVRQIAERIGYGLNRIAADGPSSETQKAQKRAEQSADGPDQVEDQPKQPAPAVELHGRGRIRIDIHRAVDLETAGAVDGESGRGVQAEQEQITADRRPDAACHGGADGDGPRPENAAEGAAGVVLDEDLGIAGRYGGAGVGSGLVILRRDADGDDRLHAVVGEAVGVRSGQGAGLGRALGIGPLLAW